jgi:hypothetical protein
MRLPDAIAVLIDSDDGYTLDGHVRLRRTGQTLLRQQWQAQNQMPAFVSQ